MEFIFDEKKLEELSQKYHLKFVILHGSYATGKQRHDSDLDIAVLGEKALPFDSFYKLLGEFSGLFGNEEGRELDFKALHRVDPYFRYEAVSHSKLLYGDPADYEEFKAFSQRAYEDARPLLELEKILSARYQKHLNSLAHAQS